ncbi:hypothetical protein F5Y08DRAFT_311978 [Xylaria arbuscula]|nr:hypothetical protein F5Y08DRAFT_311978 [Xylaria arbuscula]
MRTTLSRLAVIGRSSAGAQAQFSPVDVKTLGALNDPQAAVRPGQHVLSVCRQYDISFPDELRFVKRLKLPPNPYKISVTISQNHCFLHQSMKYFDRFEHPFAKSLLDIYIEKKKEPLWFSALAYGGSPFASRTAARKINHALRDALAAAGYDRFGRRALVDGETSAIADLHGSLRVVSAEPVEVCKAKFADLLQCAKKILFAAELNLRRDKNGVHFERAQQKQYSPRGRSQDQKRFPSRT